MTALLPCMAAAAVGAALAALTACLPGLHIYSVMALLAGAAHRAADRGLILPPAVVAAAALGMTVGYAILNSVPSILLGAPDESALFTVLPGQKYLMQGRGREAVLLTAAGGLAGLFLLVLVFGPVAPRVVGGLRTVFQPHQHWILWCVICFMLMSEWPKGGTRGQGGWRKLWSGWRTLLAGLATFLLAGLLGFILVYRSPISVRASFQNLMPAFVGLFGLPWLILNLAARTQPPPQHPPAGRWPPAAVGKGVLAGALGGGFAAFFPVVTGGVGGLLAGHATATRDDRTFLVSQGASKLIYYTGGLLLFFVPGAGLTRGGAAWLLRGLYTPSGQADYYRALGAAAVAGMVACLLVGPLSRAVLRLADRVGYRRLSAAALALAVSLVWVVTGLKGVAVTAVATGIGLLPVLFGSRRMNCLGVILLPMACNMSGAGSAVARWLRLL